MKKNFNKKLTVRQLEERTNVLMQQLMVLQEMVDMVGDNFIKYVRFKKDEKRFMNYIKKERKPKSAKTVTKRKVSS
tara:strand:- start:402 stop:629 length:228 start_codon:yes stop_codon:yes gene_type:complete